MRARGHAFKKSSNMDLQENTDLPLCSTEDKELRLEHGILSNARSFSSVFERIFEKYDREFDEDEGGGEGLNCQTEETFENDISKIFGDESCTERDIQPDSNIIEEPDVIIIDPTETALLHEMVVQVKKEINWDDEESKFHQDPHFIDLNLSLSAAQNASKIKEDLEDELISDYDEISSCYDTLESDYEENLASFVLSPERGDNVVSDEENFFVPSKDTDGVYSTHTTESTTAFKCSADIDSSMAENSHTFDAAADQGQIISGPTLCSHTLKQTNNTPCLTPSTFKRPHSNVTEHSASNKVDNSNPHLSIVRSNQPSTDTPRDPCPTTSVAMLCNQAEGKRTSIHSGAVVRLKSAVVNIQKIPVKTKDMMRVTTQQSSHIHPHGASNQPVEYTHYTLSPFTCPVPNTLNGDSCHCITCQDLYPPTYSCMCSCYSSYAMPDVQYPSCSLCAAQNQQPQCCHCNPSTLYRGNAQLLLPRRSDENDCHINATISNGCDIPMRRMKRQYDEIETEKDDCQNNVLSKRHCT